MLKNENRSQCEYGDEIVSYIYKEMDAAGLRDFESHLSGCTVCTDEFASISNARFSLFEWRAEEFAHLETPEINIPYPERQVVSAAAAGSRSAGLWGYLSGFRTPAFAAAGIVTCLGIGLAAFLYIGTPEQNLTSENRVPAVQPSNPLPHADVASTFTVPPDMPDAPAAVVPDELEIAATPRRSSGTTVKIRNAKPTKRAVEPSRINIDNEIEFSSNPQVSKAPVLSSFEEVEDRSLRLSDLFDDEGAG